MTNERIILACVAIITGLIVALSTFSFYQQKNNAAPTPTPSTHSGNDNKSVALTVDSPEDESVVDKKTVTLKGAFLPKALIVVVTNLDDFVLTADDDGKFEQELTLALEENVISITAYADNGAIDTKELSVTQNSEEF